MIDRSVFAAFADAQDHHWWFVARRQILRRIVDVTLANPLFALELGRELLANGVPAAAEELPVPAGIEDLPRHGSYVLGAMARHDFAAADIIDALGISKQRASQVVARVMSLAFPAVSFTLLPAREMALP